MGRAGPEMIADMLWRGGLLLCAAPDLSLVRLCALWVGLILLLAVPYLWASRWAPKPGTKVRRLRGGSTYRAPRRPVARRM